MKILFIVLIIVFIIQIEEIESIKMLLFIEGNESLQTDFSLAWGVTAIHHLHDLIICYLDVELFSCIEQILFWNESFAIFIKFFKNAFDIFTIVELAWLVRHESDKLIEGRIFT